VKMTVFSLAITVLMMLFLLPTPAAPQEEVASPTVRYKQYEASTGYYEEYEVLPQRGRPIMSVPGVARGRFSYSPSAAQVRIRTRLVDSHQGIKFYRNLRCETCHMEQTRDIHTVRAKLTCRQCHGGEPIASIQHYYSPMNPIRKHAYICAKCHQGASASFASYVVHTPNPAMKSTRKTFPLLFYTFWIMVALAVCTFLIFLPHTFLWAIREFFSKREKSEGGSHAKKKG